MRSSKDSSTIEVNENNMIVDKNTCEVCGEFHPQIRGRGENKIQDSEEVLLKINM